MAIGRAGSYRQLGTARWLAFEQNPNKWYTDCKHNPAARRRSPRQHEDLHVVHPQPGEDVEHVAGRQASWGTQTA